MIFKRKKVNKIGDRIKAALMNQRKLANLALIPEVELSNKINGVTDFTEDELVRIEKILNIELCSLLTN